MSMDIRSVQLLAEKLENNMNSVIMGKEDVLKKVILCVLCDGHILLEDLPGTGKTTLAKALSKSIDCTFRRMQFTPDLLPSDLTGINFFDRKENEFVFKPGPAFTNILLGDEINRATPRTQSSLLECMEERQVTVDGVTHALEKPFLVIATQNPVEIQGTFPLPEAQLDRFFMRLSMGYPDKAFEMEMLSEKQHTDPMNALPCVITKEQLIEAQSVIRQVKVSDAVREYIVNIVRATRSDSRIRMGVSPRGSLAFMRGAQAQAAVNGRDYVLPDDVKAVCVDILAHRTLCRGRSLTQSGALAAEILTSILGAVQVPIE
jgi:MoxR-like ATPase